MRLLHRQYCHGPSRWPKHLLSASLLLLAALLLADEAPPAQQPVAAAAAAKTYRTGAVIHFAGPITPWLEGYFNRKLAAAKKAGADLVVLVVDSPGGYVDESGNMAGVLRDTDWARTVAYVPDEALSGA